MIKWERLGNVTLVGESSGGLDALTHAGVYANLASSKGSEQSMEQLKNLAVPLPLTVAEPEPDHRAPLWRRLLRHEDRTRPPSTASGMDSSTSGATCA